MNPVNHIFFRVFVRPFFRANASLFVFLFVVMFGVIGKVDGRDVVDYHVFLISEMLDSFLLTAIVLFAWSLYFLKCGNFMLREAAQPVNSFLKIFTSNHRSRLFVSLLFVTMMLYLPVIIYAVFVLAVGIHEHKYVPALLIFLFPLACSICNSLLITKSLLSGQLRQLRSSPASLWLARLRPGHCLFMIRYVISQQGLLFIGLKFYDCALLYLMLRNNIMDRSDIRMVFIFYSFGLIAHSFLIFSVKTFEEEKMSWLRALPFSLLKRFINYCFFYLLILTPEITTLCFLSPGQPAVFFSPEFIISSFALLMFCNSLLHATNYSMRDFLKIVFGVFMIMYVGLMTEWLVIVSCAYWILSFAMLLAFYYKYEWKK